MRTVRRFTPGVLSADHLNQLIDAANWCLNIRAEGRLQLVKGAAGPRFTLDDDSPFWIKITGSSTSTGYPWQEVIRAAAGGSWVSGSRASTTATLAVEANGNTGVPLDTIVLARFVSSSGELIFNWASC